MKAIALTPVFTKSIPADPEPGNLYVSMEYRTAVHLCACGCGTKAVTPIGPNDWTLIFNGEVTLRPSVGSGQQPCRSHYHVADNRIVWLPPLSESATRAAAARDRAAHAAPAAPLAIRKSWWRAIGDRVRRGNSDDERAFVVSDFQEIVSQEQPPGRTPKPRLARGGDVNRS